jgi:glycopeptide antibiotics resistance protein
MRQQKIGKIIAWSVSAIYIIMLLRLAVFRDDFMEYGFFQHGTLNIVPFALYLKLLKAHTYQFMFVQFIGNIGWFVPFGFLLPFLTGKPKTLKHMALFGFLLSFAVELSQYAFGTGVTELDDLILNTFGTAVGFLLFKLYRHIKQREKV